MGERRFDALSRPAKEVVVGVCWPFSVNQDGMADGLQLALDEINTGNLAGGYTIRLVMRDDAFDWQKAKRIAVEFANTPDMSAVIGYYDDAPAVKASTIFESSRLLHLIVGANNTAMTSHGFQYIVRTILSSDKIAQSLARMTVRPRLSEDRSALGGGCLRGRPGLSVWRRPRQHECPNGLPMVLLP